MNQKIIITIVLLAIGLAVGIGSFSALGGEDCEWQSQPLEAPDGTTFDSLEELENYVGEEEYNELMEDTENPNIRINTDSQPIEVENCI